TCSRVAAAVASTGRSAGARAHGPTRSAATRSPPIRGARTSLAPPGAGPWGRRKGVGPEGDDIRRGPRSRTGVGAGAAHDPGRDRGTVRAGWGVSPDEGSHDRGGAPGPRKGGGLSPARLVPE